MDPNINACFRTSISFPLVGVVEFLDRVGGVEFSMRCAAIPTPSRPIYSRNKNSALQSFMYLLFFQIYMVKLIMGSRVSEMMPLSGSGKNQQCVT
jgi:hypothetical protein